MNNVNQEFGSSFEEIIAVLLAEPDSQAPASQQSTVEEEKVPARVCSEVKARR
jgi:hypothetical protein